MTTDLRLRLRGNLVVEVVGYFTTSHRSPTPGVRLIIVRLENGKKYITRLDNKELKVYR